MEYTYNGDGLRTQKAVKSSKEGYIPKVTNYIYDRQHVILETDGASNLKTRYVRGLNYIARYSSANQLSYYLYNGHGDVVQTVSKTGEVQNQYDYDIFGNPILTVEVYENAIRYAGEFYDAETGLYYLRARYYDPYTGRFISEDSYWGEDSNPLSLNLYTYAYNNPIMYVDPSGHKPANYDTDGGGGSYYDIDEMDDIDEIIEAIDKQKEAWWDEEKAGGKGTTELTVRQQYAHESADVLRARLAELEQGNSDVAKLVDQSGKDTGTWEGYKKDRKRREIEKKEEKGEEVTPRERYEYYKSDAGHIMSADKMNIG